MSYAVSVRQASVLREQCRKNIRDSVALIEATIHRFPVEDKRRFGLGVMDRFIVDLNETTVIDLEIISVR